MAQWVNYLRNNSFVNPMRLCTFAVLNFWSCTPSITGSYGRLAGWLADKIQLIFKIHYRSLFALFITNVQHYYCCANAFKSVFSAKAYCKMVFKCAKIWKPQIFMAIPTIKYYRT